MPPDATLPPGALPPVAPPLLAEVVPARAGVPPEMELPPEARLPPVAAMPPEAIDPPCDGKPPVDDPPVVFEVQPENHRTHAETPTSTGPRAMCGLRPKCRFVIDLSSR
jgi:hypothetical protein